MKHCAAALLACLLLAGPGLADPSPAYLVKDIAAGTSNGGLTVSRAVESGGRAFLFIGTPETGWEIWTSDGTPAGTQLVKMIDPSLSNTDHESVLQLSALADLAGTLVFRINDGIHGMELWKSDGTAAGTTLVKDICPGSCPSAVYDSGMPVPLVSMGDSLFFMADGLPNGYGLWKTDGTEAGTVLVKALSPGKSVPVNVNGTLFFTVRDAPGVSLWKSDGTTGGTVPVKQIATGTSSDSQYDLTNVNGRLFFAADDGIHGRELWTSDGTTAGTAMVLDMSPGSASSIVSDPAELTAVGSTLFFVAEDGVNGSALWKSDGTAAGTVLVSIAATAPEDAFPFVPSRPPFALTEVSGTLLFVGWDATSGSELWKSDGTTAGTVQVVDICSGACSGLDIPFFGQDLENVGGTVFFDADNGVDGEELWKSDGTAAGTVLVKDLTPSLGSSTFPRKLANVNGTLFFAARSQLWKSDGTSAGTVMVGSVPVGPSSWPDTAHAPEVPGALGGWLLFDAVSSSADALWKSDGTSAGTSQVMVATSGARSDSFTELNGSLLFKNGGSFIGAELYKTDGTPAGSGLLKEIRSGSSAGSDPDKLTRVNGTVYFTANNGTNGTELWKTDGTTAGTVLVKDVTAGSTSTSFGKLLDFDGTLFFATLTDLWKSDGTSAGTVVVHDIDPAELIVMDHTLYIGSGELWKSDGTTAGTVLLKDVRAGSSNSNPRNFARIGSTLYFTASGSSNNGDELWKTDGTEAGTVLVKNIWPAAFQSSSPRNLMDVSGTLFFTADDGVHGRELWKSDGTAAGTVLVKDIGPYEATIDPLSLTPVGSVVVFSGDDGSSGREPWISDGTPEGTRMLANIAPMGSSSPRHFKRAGDLLYFRALTNAIGGELYAVPVAALTDADLDGLLDADERALGTDEFDADTDDDGLSDGAEVNSHGTDPLLADTDGDGFSDSAELQYGTDPLDPQSAPPAVPVGGLWTYSAIAAGLIAAARRRLGRAVAN